MSGTERTATVERKTTETEIFLKLNVDGSGTCSVETKIPFFNHMLHAFTRHAVVDLELRCDGDVEVDAHHTVEDCGIALGEAFTSALAEKRGIHRYGFASDDKAPVIGGESYVPMDECLARCVIDFSGRPYLVWRGMDDYAYKMISEAEREQDMSSRFRFGLAREFFQGFTNAAKCNLHLEMIYGDEPHHIVEALFKAFAKAVDFAVSRDPRISGQIPSSKGKL